MTQDPDAHMPRTERRLLPSRRAWMVVGSVSVLTAGCLAGAFLSDRSDRSIFLLCSSVGLITVAWSVWRIRTTTVLVGPDWVEVRTPLKGRTRLNHAEILEVRSHAVPRSPAALRVQLIGGTAVVGVAFWAYGMAGLAWGLVVLVGWAAALDRGRSASLTLIASEGRSVVVPGWLQGVSELRFGLPSPREVAP